MQIRATITKAVSDIKGIVTNPKVQLGAAAQETEVAEQASVNPGVSFAYI